MSLMLDNNCEIIIKYRSYYLILMKTICYD